MCVEKDLQSALSLVNNDSIDQTEYRKVKIYTEYSLKHYKKYKLDGKNVLVRLGNYCSVADLISYGANVTCFSQNKLDKYFLEYFLKSFDLDYKSHVNLFFNNEHSLSKNKYNMIKDKLTNETKYFFDELYNLFSPFEIYNALIVKSKYNYYDYLKCVRYLLKAKYNIVSNNLKNNLVQYCTEEEVFQNVDDRYNLIDLSYNLDQIKSREFSKITSMIPRFSSHLLQYGKIQVFISKDEEIILDEYKRIQTRSIDDLNSNKKESKNEYAYVYSK